MTDEEFVRALIIAVHDASIEGIMEGLASPLGRRPHPGRLRLSEWFNALGDADQKNVEGVVADAVDGAIFGFLCVLDGVRAIEDVGEKGSLELWYVRDGERTLLNQDQVLHDVNRAELPPK
jgi:hypothetical protein